MSLPNISSGPTGSDFHSATAICGDADLCPLHGPESDTIIHPQSTEGPKSLGEPAWPQLKSLFERTAIPRTNHALLGARSTRNCERLNFRALVALALTLAALTGHAEEFSG